MKGTFWKSGALSAAIGLFACDAQDGEGAASFTTWGEAYIEQGIPADPTGEEGFLDGWTVRYDKFLVVLADIELAAGSGSPQAGPDSMLVDHVQPGIKKLHSFRKLRARHWDQVRYQIRPADADTELIAADAEDLELMIESGYSIYVEGRASKEGKDGETELKSFHWGFRTATQYSDCQQAEESGQALAGIVVANGSEDVSELTIHGDHLFYDRLVASDDPALKTALRFDAIAAADKDDDGEVTLDELFATRIDVRLYDPSGLPATSLGAFMTALVRTLGHFRGEGECSVSVL